MCVGVVVGDIADVPPMLELQTEGGRVVVATGAFVLLVKYIQRISEVSMKLKCTQVDNAVL